MEKGRVTGNYNIMPADRCILFRCIFMFCYALSSQCVHISQCFRYQSFYEYWITYTQHFFNTWITQVRFICLINVQIKVLICILLIDSQTPFLLSLFFCVELVVYFIHSDKKCISNEIPHSIFSLFMLQQHRFQALLLQFLLYFC